MSACHNTMWFVLVNIPSVLCLMVILFHVLLQIVQQFILSALVWSPIEQFSNVRYSCPKCTEAENSYLIPTTWMNGHVHHPRLIHDHAFKCFIV